MSTLFSYFSSVVVVVVVVYNVLLCCCCCFVVVVVLQVWSESESEDPAPQREAGHSHQRLHCERDRGTGRERDEMRPRDRGVEGSGREATVGHSFVVFSLVPMLLPLPAIIPHVTFDLHVYWSKVKGHLWNYFMWREEPGNEATLVVFPCCSRVFAAVLRLQ